MAFKIIDRVPCEPYPGENGFVITAVCDAAADVALLGTSDGCGNNYAPGSVAYVAASTPEVHMLNASGSWVKVK